MTKQFNGNLKGGGLSNANGKLKDKQQTISNLKQCLKKGLDTVVLIVLKQFAKNKENQNNRSNNINIK